ncbi:transglycosylase domain-containing protein [Veillonella sp. VA139]|uniref:transglycosylase domain-containing protein n=1 Tax=Veillonella sp. VA139 TaxID=741830 RepID=UPI000F8C8FB1|nr:biosynthetic peptidoglycan transglycosylase [Veillonella sp. VA139]
MKTLFKLILVLAMAAAGVYWFAGYTPEDASNATQHVAHTIKEQTIEQGEDQLSRIDRIKRLFHFKKAVEEAMDKRVEHRVRSEDINPIVKQALVATEDKRFYEHGAVDFFSIGRALYTNIIAGQTVEGGSTITQQLVKNLFLSSKRIMSRKVEEIFLAYLMEHYYSKDEIITMYLNTIYYGTDYYGIKAASEGYFNTDPKDLNLSQAAVLAGIPQAPSYFNPVSNMDATKQRQRTVLTLMAQQGIISYADIDRAYYKRLDAPKKHRVTD